MAGRNGGDEPSIELDGRRLPAEGFALFSGEARALLTAIRAEHQALRHHSVVTDTLIRSVQSLERLSVDVSARPLGEACFALGGALEGLSLRELSEDEQSLIIESIDTVDDMVSAVMELRTPAPATRLVAELARIGHPDAFVPELPEIEPAYAADAAAEEPSPPMPRQGGHADLAALQSRVASLRTGIRELRGRLRELAGEAKAADEELGAIAEELERALRSAPRPR